MEEGSWGTTQAFRGGLWWMAMFPPVLGSSVIKFRQPAKSDSLGIPSPFAGSPGWEVWWGPRTFPTVWELLWYNCSPICESLTWRLYVRSTGPMVGLMATSSKRSSATRCVSQDCCCQRPCPSSRPVLTHASAGESQTLRQVWLSLLWGSCSFPLGPGVPMVLFVLSKSLWQVWGLILMWLWLPYHLVVTFLSLDLGYLFLVDSNILLLMIVQQSLWF